jgi:LacI family transcriptional regulator
VSRALNGGVVSAAARARIEAAVARLGYRRNDVARGLVTGRSGLVGVVLPDLIGPLYAQMARGIEDVLEASAACTRCW